MFIVMWNIFRVATAGLRTFPAGDSYGCSDDDVSRAHPARPSLPLERKQLPHAFLLPRQPLGKMPQGRAQAGDLGPDEFQRL